MIYGKLHTELLLGNPFNRLKISTLVNEFSENTVALGVGEVGFAPVYIELKLALSDALTKRRKKSNLTQAQLAKLLKSSQSRVAKMEKGDPSVSVDLLVKSLLAMGANKESIAKAIA